MEPRVGYAPVGRRQELRPVIMEVRRGGKFGNNGDNVGNSLRGNSHFFLRKVVTSLH